MEQIPNKEIQESVDKWGDDLWDRLEKSLRWVYGRRHEAWIKCVWKRCSYCLRYEFCNKCPLNQEGICFNHLKPSEFITAKAHDAWVSNDREKFEEARKMIVDAMKRHMKEEDV